MSNKDKDTRGRKPYRPFDHTNTQELKRRLGGKVKIPIEILEDNRLTDSEKVTYAFIKAYRDAGLKLKPHVLVRLRNKTGVVINHQKERLFRRELISRGERYSHREMEIREKYGLDEYEEIIDQAG